LNICARDAWQRIRTDHRYTTQAALAIPEKQDKSGGQQDNKANNEKDHRQQCADTCRIRRDIEQD